MIFEKQYLDFRCWLGSILPVIELSIGFVKSDGYSWYNVLYYNLLCPQHIKPLALSIMTNEWRVLRETTDEIDSFTNSYHLTRLLENAGGDATEVIASLKNCGIRLQVGEQLLVKTPQYEIVTTINPSTVATFEVTGRMIGIRLDRFDKMMPFGEEMLSIALKSDRRLVQALGEAYSDKEKVIYINSFSKNKLVALRQSNEWHVNASGGGVNINMNVGPKNIYGHDVPVE